MVSEDKREEKKSLMTGICFPVDLRHQIFKGFEALFSLKKRKSQTTFSVKQLFFLNKWERNYKIFLTFTFKFYFQCKRFCKKNTFLWMWLAWSTLKRLIQNFFFYSSFFFVVVIAMFEFEKYGKEAIVIPVGRTVYIAVWGI